MSSTSMSASEYIEIQNKFRKRDRIKQIIGIIMGMTLGIGGSIMSNTIAVSFGVDETNDWMFTFSFSMVYDIFIHQTLKAIMICIIVLCLGSNKGACPGCRNGCLKLISKSLLEAFLR